MKIIKVIAAIIGILFVVSISLLGAYVPGQNQIRILEVIIIFASIIFAIIGVWLAVVFPEVMQGIYDNHTAEDKRSLYKKGKRLIFPLVLASGSAFSALLTRIAAEVLANAGVAATIGSCTSRITLFTITVILVVGLGVSLVMAVAPGLQMLVDGYQAVKHTERNERFFARTQRED